jgi:RNA ligase (TIGR02306 family)
MRKLATIQKIREILPIEGADSIEIAVVNSWKVVTKKGEYNPGDLCIYCEIDSFLPIREEFEFLRKSSYRKMSDGTEGFRLKTIKLRGQISQGLILPLSTLNSKNQEEPEMVIGVSQQPWGDQLQLGPYDDALVIKEETDVTSVLGISKYEPPIPASLAGKVKGNFPSFLRKTDEERIQNMTKDFENMKSNSYYVTEKLDGSSATFYFRNGEFGVCSRNLDLIETPDNTFWKVARELFIEEKLGTLEENFAIQGELIGEGIQGNPYKIKGQTVKIFNVFNIDKNEYLNLKEMEEFLSKINSDQRPLELVPVLDREYKLPETIEEILTYAESSSALNPDTKREGVVIRNSDKSISFKAISNSFLLNQG